MISTQNRSHFEPVGSGGMFMNAEGYLDFDYFFSGVLIVQRHCYEDSHIPIFGLICALELLGLQLLRGSLADRICKRHSSLLKLLKASCWPFLWHTLFKMICSEVWLIWLGSCALKWRPCRSPPPPCEPCVSAQHIYATDLFLKLWFDSITKCISHNISLIILV